MLHNMLHAISCAHPQAEEICCSVSTHQVFVLHSSCLLFTRANHAFRWTVGSLLFLSSWAILQGPKAYAQHLLSAPRLPFSCAYFGSIALTLYFSLGVRIMIPMTAVHGTTLAHTANPLDYKLRSTILTLLAAIGQSCALLWYLVSYFPMGSQGMSIVLYTAVDTCSAITYNKIGLRFASQAGARSAVAWMQG